MSINTGFSVGPVRSIIEKYSRGCLSRRITDNLTFYCCWWLMRRNFVLACNRFCLQAVLDLSLGQFWHGPTLCTLHEHLGIQIINPLLKKSLNLIDIALELPGVGGHDVCCSVVDDCLVSTDLVLIPKTFKSFQVNRLGFVSLEDQ